MEAEIMDEPVARPLSNEQIVKDRAAHNLPDSPMEAAVGDVIGPSDSFNDMASKLDKAMKEVNANAKRSPEPDTKGVDKEQTDSKRKKVDAAAPAPEVEKKVDAPKEDDIESKTVTSAKAADWKALKAKLQAHEAQANEFKQKLEVTTKEYEEFRKKAVDSSKLEPITKERDEIKTKAEKLEEQLKTIALERSEQFATFFERKFNDATLRAKDAVGKDKAERIEQLMALPPTQWRKEQINAIREDLIGSDQGQLDIAIAEYDRARSDRESQLKDSKANYERLMQANSDKAEAEKKLAAQRTEAATASVLSFAKENYDSFKATDSDEHNAFVAESEQFVKNFFARKLDDSTIALLPILAREATRLQKSTVPALEKKVAELEAALKGYQGSNPKPSGEAAKPGINPNAKKGFIETFNENWPAGARP